MSVMAPGETVEIYRLVQAGQYDKAKEVQLRILTVNQKVVGGTGVPGIKCALDLLGYVGGGLRSPLKPVTEEQRKMIRKVLQDAGLLKE